MKTFQSKLHNEACLRASFTQNHAGAAVRSRTFISDTALARRNPNHMFVPERLSERKPELNLTGNFFVISTTREQWFGYKPNCNVHFIQRYRFLKFAVSERTLTLTLSVNVATAH